MVRLPAVVNLLFDEARRRLEQVGLGVQRRDLGPAPSWDSQHAVRSQAPGANTEVAPGATVWLDTFAAWTPSPQEQVAAMRCPPNAQAFWGEAAGGARCRCNAGFAWDGRVCALDRNAAVAGLRCPSNARHSVAAELSAGVRVVGDRHPRPGGGPMLPQAMRAGGGAVLAGGPPPLRRTTSR